MVRPRMITVRFVLNHAWPMTSSDFIPGYGPLCRPDLRLLAVQGPLSQIQNLNDVEAMLLNTLESSMVHDGGIFG
jgi:hypothetical protein